MSDSCPGNVDASPDADLSFDASALFRHFAEHLVGDPAVDEFQWGFSFSHADFGTLRSAMEQVADAFAAEVGVDGSEPLGTFDEAPVVEDEEGVRTTGKPMFTIEYTGAMAEGKLAALHRQFRKLSSELGIEYLGVEVY